MTRVPPPLAGAITSRRVGFRRLLAPRGPLCDATVSALLDEFWDAIEGGAQELWIDLSAVTAIDTPGLHGVRHLGVAAHELGRSVAVICPEGPVLRALAHASVDVGLEIYPTVSAAHYGCTAPST